MMKPKNNDLSGLSQTSMSVMNSEEGRQTVHRRPVGLTITVEKIDRVLVNRFGECRWMGDRCWRPARIAVATCMVGFTQFESFSMALLVSGSSLAIATLVGIVVVT